MAMVTFFSQIVDPALTLNMDATTFRIETNGDEFVWHIHEAGDKDQVQGDEGGQRSRKGHHKKDE